MPRSGMSTCLINCHTQFHLPNCHAQFHLPNSLPICLNDCHTGSMRGASLPRSDILRHGGNPGAIRWFLSQLPYRSGWHIWEIDLRFAPGLSLGWMNCHKLSRVRRAARRGGRGGRCCLTRVFHFPNYLRVLIYLVIYNSG